MLAIHSPDETSLALQYGCRVTSCIPRATLAPNPIMVINKPSQKNVGVGKEMEKAAEEKHGPLRTSADSGQKKSVSRNHRVPWRSNVDLLPQPSLSGGDTLQPCNVKFFGLGDQAEEAGRCTLPLLVRGLGVVLRCLRHTPLRSGYVHILSAERVLTVSQ